MGIPVSYPSAPLEISESDNTLAEQILAALGQVIGYGSDGSAVVTPPLLLPNAGVNPSGVSGVQINNAGSQLGYRHIALAVAKILGGSVTTAQNSADKALNSIYSSSFIQGFDDFDASDWTFRNGDTSKVQVVFGGVMGGSALRATGYVWMEWKRNINFDPTHVYRLRFRVRQAVDPSNAQKSFMAGLVGVAPDGVTLININGLNLFTSQHLVEPVEQSVQQVFTEYLFYWKGSTAQGTAGSPDPLNPGTLTNGVSYVRPAIIFNYNGGDGIQELDVVELKIDTVDAAIASSQDAVDAATNAAASAAYAQTQVDLRALIDLGNVLPGSVTGILVGNGVIVAKHLAANVVTADKIAAGAVVAKSLTITNFDNLWPNPSSEELPPVGYIPPGDGSDPQYDFRLNDGAGALSGVWDRQLSVTGVGTKTLSLRIPCSPGDQFYFEANAKRVSGTDATAQIRIKFLDTTLATLSNIASANLTSASWTLLTVTSAAAPAGTCYAQFELTTGTTTASLDVRFDTMYARRMAAGSIIVDGTIIASKLSANVLQTSNYVEDGSGNPTAGAKLDTVGTALKVAAGNFQIGQEKFNGVTNTNYWNRIRYALAENGSGKYFYRGNASQPPDNSTYAVTHQSVDTWSTVRGTKSCFDVQILNADENFGGGIYVVFFFMNRSFSGIQTFYRPLGFDTPGYTDGTFRASWSFVMVGDVTNPSNRSQLNMYCDVQVFTSLGANSAARLDCLKNEGTVWTVFSGGGGGGGGGGGFCPAPWALIQLESGLLIPAGDLKDGTRIVGFDAFSKDLKPISGIVRNPALQWNDRFDLYFTDGTKSSYSRYHRLVGANGWRMVGSPLPKDRENIQVKNAIFLKVGDVLPRLNMPDAVVARIVPVGRQQVVDFKVEGCNTYFSDGLASHNNPLKP